MTKLELLKELNNTLGILAWPAVALIVVYWFREALSNLASRISTLEGKFGDSQFRLEAQQIVETSVQRAVELESQGKSQEAKQVANDAAKVLSQLFGLSNEDLDYLVSLGDGEKPKRRWGAIHLVRSGLVEFDGGHLTDQGKSLVNQYKSLRRV